MNNNKSKPFRWSIPGYIPTEDGKVLKFCLPDFSKLSKIEGCKNIDLIETLYMGFLNREKLVNSEINDLHITYSNIMKSLLIDDPNCGPLIEFYFHQYAPILHSCITDINVKNRRQYELNRKHYLLTSTDEVNKELNSKKNNAIALKYIHKDGRRNYHLKINDFDFECKMTKKKFYSIKQFTNDINNRYKLDLLQKYIEKFAFMDL